MEDELIKYETANLAEEKGYLFEYIGTRLSSIPTQSLIQRWLREVWKSDVLIIKEEYTHEDPTMKYNYEVHFKDNVRTRVMVYDTYEEALEMGLQEALKLIKNES